MGMFFLLTINPKGDSMQTSTNNQLIKFDKIIRTGCFGLLIVLFHSISLTGQNLAQNEIYADYHFPLSWFSQESEESVYMQRIDVSIEEVPLAEAFEEIAYLGNLRLTYNKKLLPDTTVTLNLYDVTIIEAFYALLDESDFDIFASSRGQIVLKRKDEIKDFKEDQETVTGTVRDAETGETMPGVNIAIEGTTRGTATDQEGRFSIEVPEESVILIFSYVGYTTQRVEFDGQEVINISLEPDLGQMDEMVVIGYSAVKKSSLTSAISKIENETLDQVPVSRPESALVGRIAGLQISQTRNRPGDAPDITIRGPGSISASNDPLIVIDGFPGGSFEDINMNDIESIEVLKDASAAAIYGSRGAGGVIILTTKQGRTGERPRFNLNVYYGVANPRLHGPDNWILDGQEFYEYTARYNNRDWFYNGGDHTLPLDSPLRDDNFRPGADRDALSSGGYNWEDLLFDPAPIQNYNLSVSGGTESTNYYLSGTFKDEQGTFRSTSYRQYAVRARYNVDVNDNISAGIMLNPQYTHTRVPGGAGIQNLIKIAPFVSPEPREDGTYYRMPDYVSHVTASAAQNPIAALDRSHHYNHVFNNNGELYMSVNFLRNLTFRSSVGGKLRYQENERFAEGQANANGLPSGSEFRSRVINLLNENVLTYTETFRSLHDVTAMAGASFQHEGYWGNNISTVTGSYANETIRTMNNAVINPGPTTSMKTQWGLASYFSRVNYEYDDRYLLSASIRTDGSSRFGPNTRWGYFPSASIGWRISQEAFMEELDAIDELKLRASYGVTGNFNIGDFAYLGTIGDAPYSPGGSFTIGQAQNSFGNPDLKWERTFSYGAGLELSLFNRRLNFVVDYYDMTTKDLLYFVNTPAITGFTSSLTNVGDINNRGIELEISTINVQTNNFQWSTSFNYTYNKNQVVSLGGGVTQRTNTHARGMGWLLREGEPMFSYYGHRMLGVIQSEEELNQVPTMTGQPVGTIRFEDVNGDGVINDDDRVILGNFMPDFYLGMVNDFYWKNLDFSIVMQASIGGMMYNHENLFYQGATTSALLRPIVEGQWWSPEEPGDGNHPAASLAVLQYIGSSDYYLEDASFLAVRSINLGYSLPNSLLQTFNVNNLRVYLSITNPVMLTKDGFHGYNPEGRTNGISGPGSFPGLNNGSEPLNRTIAFGLNMNF
jgi:TonB-dependent starch-binding outer membrane protein SusC